MVLQICLRIRRTELRVGGASSDINEDVLVGGDETITGLLRYAPIFRDLRGDKCFDPVKTLRPRLAAI